MTSCTVIYAGIIVPPKHVWGLGFVTAAQAEREGFDRIGLRNQHGVSAGFNV